MAHLGQNLTFIKLLSSDLAGPSLTQYTEPLLPSAEQGATLPVSTDLVSNNDFLSLGNIDEISLFFVRYWTTPTRRNQMSFITLTVTSLSPRRYSPCVTPPPSGWALGHV